jgi:5-methylcytosine-specific restriction enzyme A
VPIRVQTHRHAYQPTLAQRRRDYDRSRRNKDAKAFYNSRAWQECRLSKLRQDPLCEPCKRRNRLVPATHVHHLDPVSKCEDSRLEISRMESQCASCHSTLHAEETNP